MTEQDGFDAIARRVLPGCRVTAVRALTGGVSADVRSLDLEYRGAQRRLVLRSFGDAVAKPRHRQAAQLEYRLLGALHRAGVPVPEPLLLDTSGTAMPGPVLVMEFVPGSTEIPAADEASAVPAMAAALARLHDLPVDGLPELPPREDPLPEVFDYLPDAHAWDPLRRALSGLEDSAYRGRPVLLHGDYWPGNLLWRERRLVAVLDWEDAAFGDPMSDVASCRLELRWKLGPAAADGFVDHYRRSRAVDERRLALWSVFVARAAATFMGNWGLEAEREAGMRAGARAVVREAAQALFGEVAPVPDR